MSDLAYSAEGDEIWWRCPHCGQTGGFCGYANPPHLLFGLCVPHPGDKHRIRNHDFSATIECHGCGWRGTWKEAGATERITN